MPIKHYLNFVTSEHGLIEITEPIGFDALPFVIKQDNGRKGRDVLYAGGEDSKLQFYHLPNQALEILRYNNEKYGFEATIEYTVEFNDTQNVVGELSDIIDKGEYIEAIVVEKGARALFKARYDVPTDMFAEKTHDGLDITPYPLTNFLLKSKPVVQVSEWTNPQYGQQTFHDNPASNADYVMVIKNQVQYDIKNSLNWLSDNNTDDGGGFEDFIFVDAQTKYKNILIEFNLNMIYDYLPQSGLDEAGQVLLRVYYGQSSEEGEYTQINVWDSIAFGQETPQQQILPTYLTAEIPYINNTDKIWISFVSATTNGAVNRLTWNECSIKITATSIGYNTIVPAFRVHEVMKYNAKISADLPVSCPRWDLGGAHYNLVVTTQALMRLLYDKPFNVTTKEIVEDFLPLFNGDYQLQATDEIFYGIEQDFYRDYEIANFEQETERGFEKRVNERFFINKQTFAFKNFASQKEQETGNSYDIVHASVTHLLPNKKATNSRDIQVGWIFDAYMLRQAQDKALNLSDTTATQDDDKKYCVDIIEMTSDDRLQNETATLKHEKVNSTTLKLTNDQSFSWIQIGARVGNSFSITSTDNTGLYVISNVTDTTITLISGAEPSNFLTSNTTFLFFIPPTVANYVNRTDEGFSEITGLLDGNNYSNLPYTSARNVLNFHSAHLATAQMYRPDEEIQTIEYKNNPDALTRLDTETESIREGDNFIATNPILTPYEYTSTVRITMEQLFNLQALQRTQNGYISVLDWEGVPLKLYIKEASWISANKGQDDDTLIGTCEIVGEEKYNQFIMKIFSSDGVTTINGNIIPSNFTFEFEDEGKLHIFDGNGKLLHIPVYYWRVQVNNSGVFNSTTELGLALRGL